MVASAQALAAALVDAGVDVVGGASATRSHAFALRAPNSLGLDGHQLAQHLRSANILTSAIGVPDGGHAVRLGTNEIVRWGMTSGDMAPIASLVERALRTSTQGGLESLASDVRAFRSPFDHVTFAG